jgi:hypothetical protein
MDTDEKTEIRERQEINAESAESAQRALRREF